MSWQTIDRPGYFGRSRDKKIAKLNKDHGIGNWRLVWIANAHECEYAEACKLFYERSYLEHLEKRPADVDLICSFGECIDNAITNIQSGLDYTKQEAFSTHIQDIAVRNVLNQLGRKFEGSIDNILTIHGGDSNGFRFGPGNVPFYNSDLIQQPSKRPGWASEGSVEDFWQSNKYLQIKTL